MLLIPDGVSGHVGRESHPAAGPGLAVRANKTLTKFRKDKGKVLHLGKHNPGLQHRLGYNQLGFC